MPTLRDDIRRLLASIERDPAPGVTLWSFHTRETPVPLEEDDVIARIESGEGVLALELVFDDDLEVHQRGTGRKLKCAADVRALVRERFEPQHASTFSSVLEDKRGISILRRTRR